MNILGRVNNAYHIGSNRAHVMSMFAFRVVSCCSHVCANTTVEPIVQWTILYVFECTRLTTLPSTRMLCLSVCVCVCACVCPPVGLLRGLECSMNIILVCTWNQIRELAASEALQLQIAAAADDVGVDVTPDAAALLAAAATAAAAAAAADSASARICASAAICSTTCCCC